MCYQHKGSCLATMLWRVIAKARGNYARIPVDRCTDPEDSFPASGIDPALLNDIFYDEGE